MGYKNRLTLSDFRCGEQAKVRLIHDCTPAYRKRILAMGLVPGTIFSISRIAPLGDPIEIVLRNSLLCLRQQEIACLELERV